MADKVGLKESEYDALVQSICSSHESSLEEIEVAVTKMQGLINTGGAIGTDKLTPKISQVITELKSVKANIEKVFSTQEEVIESFRNTINNYDTCC